MKYIKSFAITIAAFIAVALLAVTLNNPSEQIMITVISILLTIGFLLSWLAIHLTIEKKKRN